MRIGLILKNLDEEYQLAIYRGVKEEAQRKGIRLVCIHGDNFNSLRELPLLTGAWSIPLDGLLILSSVLVDNLNNGTLVAEFSGSLPLVSIGGELGGCPSVLVDSRTAMENLIKHLIHTHSYKRFLYLGGPVTNSDNLHRQDTIEKTIAEARKKNNEYSLIVMNGEMFSETSGAKLMRRYIEEHPEPDIDIVIGGSDEHAIGAMAFLKTCSHDGWKQCPVTGYDDIPQASSEYLSLTTIRQPLEQLGRIAAKTLIDTIRGKHVYKIQMIPAELVIRESCGCERKDFQEFPIELEKDAFVFSRSISYFGQSLMGAQNEDNIITSLREFLVVFEVENFHLLVFEKPSQQIPDSAILLFSISDGIEYKWDKGDKHVSVSDFFDKTVSPSSDKKEIKRPYFLFQLCSAENKLGLILYSVEDYALPYMSNCGVFLANTVRGLAIARREQAYAEDLERQVIERTEQLQNEAQRRIAVEAEVLRISDLERRRFSMDLHDDICQRLAGIHMICKSYADTGDHMKILSKMSSEALHQTRQYAYSSFPIDVQSIGLEEALISLCADIDGQEGFSCQYSCSCNVFGELSEQEEINLYRIAREATFNAFKHSHGTLIRVSIKCKRSRLFMEIIDNGCGNSLIGKAGLSSDKTRRPRGLGLRSMEYRAHQIEADFKVRSSESGGTSVLISIPIGKDGHDG